MIGCKPLTQSEVESIASELSIRDRAIFILGIRTGFRASELLSLNIDDIITSNGEIKNVVKVKRSNTKGKVEGQAVPLHREAIEVLQEYLKAFPGTGSDPLFRSKKSGIHPGGTRLDYTVFYKAIKKAASRAGIRDTDLVATHSMRKTFADRMFKALDENIFKLQQAMRHKSPQSTISYVSVNREEIENAIRKMK